MTAGVNEPPFPHSSDKGTGGSAERGHDIKSNPEAGETAPAGETFSADNPVENAPFPGTMSRG